MRRVVKVGGSLLLRGDLPESLRHWIESQAAAQTFVVFGGGELIDAIRHLDQLRPGDPSEVHWRCVDLLQVTFEIASTWLADWPRVDTTENVGDALAALTNCRPAALVSVRSFYRRDSGSRLPLNWNTTADSIAAELAVQVDADELVLLKSCDIDPFADTESLAQRGIVDRSLATISPRVKSIRVEKLSSAALADGE